MTPAMGRDHSQKPLQTEGPGKELPPKSYREHVAERVSSRLAIKHHQMSFSSGLFQTSPKRKWNLMLQCNSMPSLSPSRHTSSLLAGRTYFAELFLRKNSLCCAESYKQGRNMHHSTSLRGSNIHTRSMLCRWVRFDQSENKHINLGGHHRRNCLPNQQEDLSCILCRIRCASRQYLFSVDDCNGRCRCEKKMETNKKFIERTKANQMSLFGHPGSEDHTMARILR